MQLQVYSVQCAVVAQVFDVQHHILFGVIHNLRKVAGHLAAKHHGNDLIHVQILVHFHVTGIGAVTQDGDVIAAVLYLAHTVRDEDHNLAFVGKAAGQCQKPLDAVLGQGAGGLVQNDDLGILGENF